MAEGKRSVIIYADLIHTVKKMPKEKAGELFMTILEYINDLNPVIEDFTIDLVFEPIKQQMKRDLKKWESIKEKRSEAGKASAEAKKLAKDVQQTSTKTTSVKSVEQNQQSSTNPTVSVNVNDTVTVNDNVNEINNIMEFFDFSVIKNADKQRDCSTFINLLIHQGLFYKFKEQFSAYKKLKGKDSKFKHSFKNFVGTAKELYLDGAWNSENWISKIPKDENQIITSSGFVAPIGTSKFTF